MRGIAYPHHRSDTGSFQELARESDGIEFGQLSSLTVAPGCSRGGHYHTHKKEWFCCLRGECYLIATDVRAGAGFTYILDGRDRVFVKVDPYTAHTVLNHSGQECELLVISSEEYDSERPDTVKWEKGKR